MKLYRSLFPGALAALLSVPAFAAPTTWIIDPAHSVAGFSVKHLLVSTVRGELGTVSGTVTYDPADPTKTVIDATIDVKTLSTHNDGRDKHLNSPDFFDTAKFPTATFKSTSVTKAGDGKLTVVGNLTLKGVTKPITLEVDGPAPEQAHPMKKGSFVSGASATGTLDRKDFGVSYGADSMVSDKVQLQLDVELDRKG